MEHSKIIQSMEASATLSLAQRVRELRAAGKDVLGLTMGEPDFDTPAYIREAAKTALDEGYTHYPPVAGLPELREEIAVKLRRENGLDYAPSQVVVSTGAKQSLYNVILSVLNPGDEAIVPAPYWVSYTAMLHLAQARVRILPTDISTSYKLTPGQLEEALSPATRLLFLTTPSNPSGSMYSREELARLVEVIRHYPQLYVISDEIYEHIAFEMPHVSLASFEELKDRVITVNGFSKGYAMTGWRLGYIAAPQAVANMCIKLQGQCTSGANTFAQRGALAALRGGLEAVHHMRDAFRQRRDQLYQRLSSIAGLKVLLPDGAFYFYPDLSHFLGMHTPTGKHISNIDELCEYLIEEVHLAVVTGRAFGTSQHVRISYAYAMEELLRAMDRLEDGLSRLRR
ncbi:MAG: pyridoxal phosphate-dependent aminotransferase [Bacteroidetes bacterium]|nr:MAG: pyridoxal phosphate-dependent aminotransferase [Bacteroidota bacterium]